MVDQRWLVASSGTATDRFTYTYDRDSNVLSRTNTLQTSLDQSFGYDDLNQLTSYSVGSSSRTWSFDTYGNATSYTDDGTTTYDNTFDDQNAQETYEDAGGTHTLASDDNGNMTTDPNGSTLTYDAWNRLVKVDSPAWSLPVVQFKYDGLGRRIYENYYTTPANGTPKHDYLYYSAAWQVIQETDASNGVIRQQNVWSPVYVDAMIERDRDTDHNGTFDERLYVQQDANWNVTAIVNTSGTVVERYAYDAYGVPTIMTGSWGSASSSAYDWRYLHQGGRYDVYTGLYCFRHRDYNPTLGRWIEQDPIGLAAGDVNLYRYEGNEPTGAVDPGGLFGFAMPVALGGVAAGDVLLFGGGVTVAVLGGIGLGEIGLRVQNWANGGAAPAVQGPRPFNTGDLSGQEALDFWRQMDRRYAAAGSAALPAFFANRGRGRSRRMGDDCEDEAPQERQRARPMTRPASPPTDAPHGTLGVDEHPDTKNIVHEIKENLVDEMVGATSYVGVSPDGRIVLTRANGTAELLTHWRNYAH